MEQVSTTLLTVCGIDELPGHCRRGVSHVLSILDPGWPELETFAAYGQHERLTLRFHDIIEPQFAMIAPASEHVGEILRFGASLHWVGRNASHALVHCHAGISRSSAAMLSLLAQAQPGEAEDRLFERLRAIRPQAWPNSLMVRLADDLLGRGGRLTTALGRHYGLQIRQDPALREQMTLLGRGREVEMAA